MKAVARSPFVAALVGGVVVAIAFLAFDVGGGAGTSTTVVQQAPVMSETPSSSSGRAEGTALTAHDIYERDAPGVVFVRARISRSVQSPFGTPQTQQGEATGSGFVIDADGYVLTNFHVVENATKVTLGFDDNTTVPARVTGTDPNNDLALLKIDPTAAKLRPLELGNSSLAEVGDPVLAIGNPFGLDRTLTTGVVSALQREIRAPNGFTIQHVIQTDAPINPGNSGGPLLDAAGRVIGINSQIATSGNGSNGSVGIGFAVPIDTAKQLLTQLKAGDVSHAYLGITGTTIDKSLADMQLKVDRGVLVQTVDDDGPAGKVGLRGGTIQSEVGGVQLALGGDVIEAIDGKAIDSMEQLSTDIGRRKPGDRVRLTVLRQGQESTVTVTLGKAPKQAPSATTQQSTP
jgi:S1-C subfamily serine protease